MLAVHGGLDAVNWLLRHPCAYYRKNDTYVSAWVSIQTNVASHVEYAVPTCIRRGDHDWTSHDIIHDYINQNPDFIIALVVRLIINNIQLCARNVVWYLGDENNNAVHADMVCRNLITNQVIVLCIHKNAKDAAHARNHAQNIVNCLTALMPYGNNIKTLLVPLEPYIRNKKILLRSTTPRRIKSKKRRPRNFFLAPLNAANS
jgi:hypothetical protein